MSACVDVNVVLVQQMAFYFFHELCLGSCLTPVPFHNNAGREISLSLFVEVWTDWKALLNNTGTYRNLQRYRSHQCPQFTLDGGHTNISATQAQTQTPKTKHRVGARVLTSNV